MPRKNIRNTIIPILLVSNTFYFVGCTNNIQTIPNQTNGSEQNTSSQQLSNKKVLSFSKVSQEKYNDLNSFMSRGLVPNSSSGIPTANTVLPAASATPASYPSVSATSNDIAPSSGSSDSSYYNSPSSYPTSIPSHYGYYSQPVPSYTSGYYGGSYFSGNFEEYIISDFEEAKTTGYTGSYLSVIKDVINPIISGLATDSRLISSYGNTNKNGVTAQNPSPDPMTSISPTSEPNYLPVPTATPYMDYSPSPYSYSYTPYYQWQFTYVSSSKKEIYSILVSSNEVLVLKQKWKLRQLVTSDIKIDSTQAIEIAEKAIKDKNYIPPIPYFNYNIGETIYDIPDGASLSYTLSEEEKGRVVWNISISMNLYSNQYYYNQGNVKVDAKTGAIIDLQRIVKMQNNYSYTTPTPYLSPPPVSEASPIP